MADKPKLPDFSPQRHMMEQLSREIRRVDIPLPDPKASSGYQTAKMVTELVDISNATGKQIAGMADISASTLTVLEESARQSVSAQQSADKLGGRIVVLTGALVALTLVLVVLTYVLVADALNLWPFT